MSKKRFTSGLDSLFSDEAQYEPNFDSSPLLEDTSRVETVVRPKRRRADAEERRRPNTRRPGKSFAADLESLFAAASSVERRPAAEPSNTPFGGSSTTAPSVSPARRSGAFGGLDALIRDTTDGRAQLAQDVADAQDTLVRKRVTFTYDRDRFAKLKKIARNEGSYLKDVISKLLNEYIDEYPASKPS